MRVDYAKLYIGRYADAAEAAWWADVWTVRLQNEHAVLNFPECLEDLMTEAKKVHTTLPWKRKHEETDQVSLQEV